MSRAEIESLLPQEAVVYSTVVAAKEVRIYTVACSACWDRSNLTERHTERARRISSTSEKVCFTGYYVRDILDMLATVPHHWPHLSEMFLPTCDPSPPPIHGLIVHTLILSRMLPRTVHSHHSPKKMDMSVL